MKRGNWTLHGGAGSSADMAFELREWDVQAGSGNDEDALRREWDPPPSYEEGADEEGRRCVVAPICDWS